MLFSVHRPPSLQETIGECIDRLVKANNTTFNIMLHAIGKQARELGLIKNINNLMRVAVENILKSRKDLNLQF